MDTGYLSKQQHLDLMAVKEGELIFLQKQVKDLQEQVNKLSVRSKKT